ncbi:hypothetical protein J4434_05785 [Candidatus Woesearchaeota archaeon]|nr:hypothetical protein [Candidatus Woesearchaeota archaeon]
MQNPNTNQHLSTNQDQGTSLTLVQTMETMYSHLPDDLRERMIKAADQMLDIGNNDTCRGQHLTSFALDAINLYKLMGISEEVIRQKVTRRLDDFLAKGRNYNLSSGLKAGIEGIRLLTEGARQLKTPNGEEGLEIETGYSDFQSKYNIARFRQLVSHLGIARTKLISYYNTSLDDALNMASAIDDEKRTFEICVHALRLGQFEVLSKIKRLSDNERILINTGMLALVDFYDHYFHCGIHNSLQNLEYAIALFGQVQGALKSEASEMLYDLAMEISNEQFIKSYAESPLNVDPFSKTMEESYLNIEHSLIVCTLRALRATGTFVTKKKDRLKTHYVTHVEDKRVVDAIKAIVEKYGHHIVEANDFSDEVRMSLRAIGDVVKLNSLADLLFEHRKSHPCRFYSESIDYFIASGNTEGVIKVIDAEMSEGLIKLEYSDYGRLIPIMAKIGYTKGLRKAQAVARRKSLGIGIDSYKREEWKKALNEAKRALAGKSSENSSEERNKDGEADETEKNKESEASSPNAPNMSSIPSYMRKALDEERKYRERIDEIRADLTPRKKRRLIEEGYELLNRGKAWDAYNRFRDALYRRGLIEAGDKMLERGDGLNALRPYTFAALLPKEEELPAGERSVLLKFFAR